MGAPASPESLKTESSDASLPILIEKKEEDQTDESIKGQPQRNESAPLWPPQLDWVYVYQVKERVDWPSSAVGFGAGIVFAGLASLLLGR